MALQFTRTDSSTGHQYTVYARVDEGNFGIADNVGVFSLSLYDSANAAARSLNPVLPSDKIILTPAEAAYLRAQGLALLYGILKARAAYSTALDV